MHSLRADILQRLRAKVAESLPQKRYLSPGEVGALAVFLCRPEALGIEGRMVKTSEDRLDDLPLPAILHVDDAHWVVADGLVTGDYARQLQLGGGANRGLADAEEVIDGVVVRRFATPMPDMSARGVARVQPQVVSLGTAKSNLLVLPSVLANQNGKPVAGLVHTRLA